MKLDARVFLICAAAAFCPPVAHAQPFQGKAVRIVNPFAAGGTPTS